MLGLLFAAFLFSGRPGAPIGQGEIPWIEPVYASFTYAGDIRFIAGLHASEPVLESRLILEYDGAREVFSPQPGGIAGEDSILVAGAVSRLPFPFAVVRYWWEADFPSGLSIDSAAKTLRYYDDSVAWKQLTRGGLTLYWEEGELADAEDAADLTLMSLGTISAELETPLPSDLTLAVYPRLADLRAAMGNRLQGWEGALSDLRGGIILLAAAPGAEGRQSLAVLIPHEITHILLAKKWGAAYAALPIWLAEGAAGSYEMGPRPEADRALRDAADAGELIPLSALCAAFPSDEGAALLAYAESKSFVAFLKDAYGLAGLRAVLAAFAGGAPCGPGVEPLAGKTLAGLEAEWRSTLLPRNGWIPPAWVLVLAGAALLAGLLALPLLVRRAGTRPSPGRKETR
jgi:hypothetical protein